MTKKQWLSRGYLLNEYINTLLEEQARAKSDALRVTPQYAGDKVQISSGNGSERKFISCAAYSEEIDRQIDKLYSIKQEILAAIKSVDDTVLQMLLVLRYVQFKKWEAIALELNYDYRWVLRLHGKALEKINTPLKAT